MSSTYVRWIEANQRLIKCFESVDQSSWQALSVAEQDQLCHSERQEVQSFLVNNQIGFANLIKERLHLAGG